MNNKIIGCVVSFSLVAVLATSIVSAAPQQIGATQTQTHAPRPSAPRPPARPSRNSDRLGIYGVRLHMSRDAVSALPVRHESEIRYNGLGEVAFVSGDSIYDGKMILLGWEEDYSTLRSWSTPLAEGHVGQDTVSFYRGGGGALLIARFIPSLHPDRRSSGDFVYALATSPAFVPYAWGHDIISAAR